MAFYSLKNPGAPVWQLATPCGVSALDFSRRNSGTLAVGCFDGSVAVYDIRGRGEQPVARAPPTRWAQAQPWAEKGRAAHCAI